MSIVPNDADFFGRAPSLLDRLIAAGLIPGQEPVRVPYDAADRCPGCGVENGRAGDDHRRN